MRERMARGLGRDELGDCTVRETFRAVGLVQYKSPLLQALQSNLRLRHMSRRTESAYVYRTKRFVRFCGLRHPADLGWGNAWRFG
jgi:Phage integrase, N-terminal SAM-like domain